MESFSFISPAQVNVSLVPVGGIGSSEFRTFAETIQSIKNVRLSDITPISGCPRFNPQAFPQGKILLSSSAQSQIDDTTFLHDFEPFRKTYIVIGIGVHQATQSSVPALHYLKEKFSTALSHSIMNFQSPAEMDDQLEIYHIEEAAEGNTAIIRSVLCNIAASFLRSLEAYASSYDKITLRSPISLTDCNVLTRTISQAQKRLSSGSTVKPSFANGQNTTSVAKDSSIKSSQKQAGRQAKLLGNFLLLAGRVQDALQYFTDSAINAKKADDYVWLASAIEGVSVSVLLLSHLGLPFQIQNPMFTSVLYSLKSKSSILAKGTSRTSTDSIASKQSASAFSPRNSMSSALSTGAHQTSANIDSQLHIIDLVLLLVSRSSHYYTVSIYESEDCAPDMVFVESLLRNVKLMATVFSSGSGDVAEALNSLVGFKSSCGTKGIFDHKLSLDMIICEIDQVFAFQLSKLDISRQCRIYCALASVFDDLGLRRKQGLVLRLLLDALLQDSRALERNLAIGDKGSIVSMREVIELLFKIYHVDERTESSGHSASRHYSDWIVLQLSLIKVCLRMVEALCDYEALMKLCVLTLSRFTHCLPAEDQIKLRDKLAWSSQLLHKSGVGVSAPYPDPFLIRGAALNFSPCASTLIPLGKEGGKRDTNLDDHANFAFFDPYNSENTVTHANQIICQNDPQHLKITFQNPFQFDIRISALRVVACDDFKLETIAIESRVVYVTSLAQKQSSLANVWKGGPRANFTISEEKDTGEDENLTIPAFSAAEAIVVFKSSQSGPCRIEGLHVAFEHSGSGTFRIFEKEQCQYAKKSKCKTDVVSSATIENSFMNLSMRNLEDRSSGKILPLIVIPPQPTLSLLESTSLREWAMLLEGETRRSSLNFKNCSEIAIDRLSILIWDSTVDSLNSKLSQTILTKSYNAAEIYELEWDLLERKALRVINKSEFSSTHTAVPPGGVVDIHFDAFGKRGMIESKLILEYGKKTSIHGDSFLKRLVVPFRVSVCRSLEIISSDIISLTSFVTPAFSETFATGAGAFTRNNLAELSDFISKVESSFLNDISDYCLLILDVKNFWKSSLSAKVTSDFGDNIFAVETKILADSVERLFIPVKRIGGSEFDSSRKIPSLRKKQYVRDYNSSDEDELKMRQSFWARFELLDKLNASWIQADNPIHRHGQLDLRSIRLNAAMTKTLLQDDISIHHILFSDDNPDTELVVKNSKIVLQTEKLYILKTRIINRTRQPISGSLRHVPYPTSVTNRQDVSIDQKILYNGSLQIHVAGENFGSGALFETKLGFLILESGQFEWGTVFDILGDHEKRVFEKKPLYMMAA